MNDVLTGNFALPQWDFWSPDAIRVVNWNIDRGMRLQEVTDFLESQKADLLILQEVDLNARRIGYVNVAEQIARKLRMNYVFGREFEELTQGRRTSPAYHGQATLSRWRLRNPRLIRFRRQSDFWRPRWFLPRTPPFQERIGGRIALITEVQVQRQRLAAYNLHLESRGTDDLRIAQLQEALGDSTARRTELPILLAGDLNLDVSRALPASTLQLAGFRSAVGLPSPHTTTPRGIFRHRHRVDWAYVSGSVEPLQARVHNTVDASDHYPISLVLRFRDA